MSKHTLNSLSLVAVLAIAVFVVAFALLLFVGDYSVLGSFFLAALVALISSIVLFLGLGSPAKPYQQPATAKRIPPAEFGATAGADVGASDQGSDDAKAAAAAAAAAEAEAKASEEAEKRAAEAEAAAAAKAEADEAAVKAAEQEAAAKAAEREAAAKAAEQEAAAKAAEQEAAAKAAAEQEAARSREEEAARKAAEEREAARVAAEEAKTAREAAASGSVPVAATASADLGEDYDGDGVLEGTNEGSRPTGLDAPRDGKADDLKQIKGIGPKLEKLCNSLGFWHFDQVAAWTSDEVAWVDANLTGFKGRVSRDEWVNQAKTLAAGGETEFSKRVEDGDVY